MDRSCNHTTILLLALPLHTVISYSILGGSLVGSVHTVVWIIVTYSGPPTYKDFTNEDLTTSILGLCMRKWDIFVLVRGPPTVPLTRILCKAVTLCIE